MENKYCLITPTFDDEKLAKKLIDKLLSERLVSCAQMSNIKSSYHWKGEIVTSDELFIQMKSKKVLYKEVEKIIIEMHNYETPQVLMYPIENGYDGYLEWIGDEIK